MSRHGSATYNLEQMVSDYNTGKFTVKEIAEKQDISAGKAYYVLRDAGCKFIRKWRKEMSEEQRKRLSMFGIGRKLSEEQKRKISERNSHNYNGLNGYGHVKKHKSGYMLAYVPKHPKSTKDGYVMLHTVIMERFIGRYLTDDEVVHHINHIRADNRIENLQLMNKKEHMSMHMRERHQKRRDALLTA